MISQCIYNLFSQAYITLDHLNRFDMLHTNQNVQKHLNNEVLDLQLVLYKLASLVLLLIIHFKIKKEAFKIRVKTKF